MKSKRRIVKIILILFCIFIIKKIIDSPPPLTEAFSGVFSYEGYTMSIMMDDDDFYFMNQLQDIYVKGKYEKKSEFTYYLSGDGFLDQEITFKNKKFDFMFDGEEMNFTKCYNVPFTFEGLEERVSEYLQKKEKEASNE